MKYLDLKKLTTKQPFFRSNQFIHLTEKPNVLRRQISDWKKQGLIIELKRGTYTLNDEDRSVKFSSFYLANHLYTPSYISCESALAHYGLIPEGVYSIISVSTKKTQTFKNPFGHFVYHRILPSLFKNYIEEKDEFGKPYFIATKEKAMIDFLYFKRHDIKIFDKDIFNLSFRFQNLEILNKQKLFALAKQMNKPKLTPLVCELIKHIKETT